ncbi:Rossmann-fold NAD(P)-binding domain-containing protein [Brumimicrobium oceani]|uniref:NAD(P)-dependent oxidoreductase n=1 Tax=Brumimicrobium oceani TaxID=2100725 RepID=A0A2U2XCM1_9FLAO|nr:NAD(P)-dependent oxidoreductase [Brumimicrobium oceani]PWH85549.1 NAD(P)-dependent oxidoreductase [Brumimicrobium oceani]
MSKNIYGVVGCGWLGLPTAKKWIQEEKTVHGTTTSKDKIESLEKVGINAHILDSEKSNEETKWLSELDYILLNIPPSSLKEEYGNFMLKIVKQLKPPAKIIFISSTSVYANNNQEVTEASELEGTRRNSAYLIDAEKMLEEFAKERLTIIRFAGLVGGDRNPAKYMTGRTISGGNDPVNLIYQDDCIGIIDHIINNSIWGEVFNGSATVHPTKKEYYTFAAKQLNIEPPTFDGENKDYKIIDGNKIAEKFGYEYKYANPFDFPD